MSEDRVIVLGAGVGGLVSAIELARAGYDVTVVEAQATPGGKMRRIAIGDRQIDGGPTVFTMRWVFDEIFQGAGAALDDHLRLRPLDILARHAWRADQRLDLFADIDRSADAIGALAGPAEADGYRAFCAEARRMYETLRGPFLTGQKTNPIGLARHVGLDRAGDLLAIRPFETLWSALGGHFRDPRLRQLFGRYATYCGSSPFAAPATLMLIARVEQDGVWTVDGGMHALAQALAGLATGLGVSFRYGQAVRTIATASGRACGVDLTDGDRLLADHVVVNADPAALASGALGLSVRCAVPARPVATRSLSALTWAIAAPTRGFPLVRHNVFFSDDYASEFDDIFKAGRLPRTPTVYVCAQDRDDGGQAPAGPERLLILANAPANGDRANPDTGEITGCETRVFDHLRRLGLEVEPSPEDTVRTTPALFNHLFPATGGALYGQASHGWGASFERPGARTRIPGLYLAGGATHPGAGVPMAALSGRLAAQRLMADRGSMRPFRRAVMSGGISTR